MKPQTRTLFVSVGTPLVVGALSALLSAGAYENYAELIKPAISPPSWLFPVVWTVLYTLMGLSAYWIAASHHPQKKRALLVAGIQLFLNFLWSPLFFTAGALLPAFILLCFLWAAILAMILLFFDIHETAGLLQIPYLLWVTFAGWLNLSVYLLNR